MIEPYLLDDGRRFLVISDSDRRRGMLRAGLRCAECKAIVAKSTAAEVRQDGRDRVLARWRVAAEAHRCAAKAEPAKAWLKVAGGGA